MARRRPSLRLLLAAVAAVQLTVPLLAALADAAYARDAEWIGIHIESKRGPNDHWPHADDCMFCQFLAQHAVAARAQGEVRTAQIASYDVSAQPSVLLTATGPFLPDSRAPPSA